MPNAKRWSPDTPHLYDLRLTLLDGSSDSHEVLDEVTSYAGLRSIEIRADREGTGHILLNGEPIYLAMVLDQGYWPQGGMTAPSDEAMRADVEWTKRFGFNGARKHQKVEDPRWLYWCDRLGLLVWGEMANARAWSPEAEEKFIAEWERAVRRDANHPCIVTWVPLNESWGVPSLGKNHPGQYAFVERVVAVHAPPRSVATRHRQRRLGAHGRWRHLRRARLHRNGREAEGALRRSTWARRIS
jgi:beta-galactosidase/beta-glucuronidase